MRKVGTTLMLGDSAQAGSLLAYSPPSKEMTKRTKSERNGFAVEQRRKSKRSWETRKE
jgi:hypothetical protein